MRTLLILGVVAFPAWGQSALERGEAARKNAPIHVPKEERDCFVPERTACSQGFRLCFEGEASGSCDGYGRETITLRPEYENEPAPTSMGMNGVRAGMPWRVEAGYPADFYASMTCGQTTIGYGVPTTPGETPEQHEVAAKKAREEAAKREAQERAKCMAREKAKVEKDRRWQRCTLLAVDACRREAFLDCKGNEGLRGLIRASWSRPKDQPASETLKVEKLAP